MNYKRASILIVVLLAASSAGDFPKDPKPCKYDDVACIKGMITFLIRDHKDGYPPLNFPSVNPLKFPEIAIKQDKSSPVNIDLLFRNCNIYGLETGTITHLKGFGKDLTNQREVTLRAPLLSWISDYTIDGKVLVLPISGSGVGNITFENVVLKVVMETEPHTKDGKTFLRVKKMKADVNPEKLYYHLTNLFNGDKALGDTMNAFLNENSMEIFKEVRESTGNALASIFKTIVNQVFQTDAYDKLFE